MAEALLQNQPQTLTADAPAESSILDRVLEEFRVRPEDKSTEQAARVRNLIRDFVGQVMAGQLVMDKTLERTIKSHIAEIDELVSDQLNEIMHHEDFQRLEASWRGLHHLVFESETGETLKIRVMNISKDALRQDLEDATEYDQSTLFRKVCSEEFDQLGGEPYGALVGDYEFSHHPEDLSLLRKLSEVAAAAHAPLISAAAPQLFGWDRFTQLTGVRDLKKIFSTDEYTAWRSFRESEDSRYVGLCLPHTLMRLPYGQDTIKAQTFNFEEKVDGRDHRKYLWGNAAWAYATRLTEAFALYGWSVAIRGVEGGGKVEGLPAHTFKSDEGDVALKCPTEIAITDPREVEFSDLGFLSLLHCKGTDYAAFIGGQSCNKPAKYYSPEANANAELSARLPYLFVVSRIAHYLRAIVRDKVGGFMSREDCEIFLNKWITNYVTPDDTALPEYKAKKPLRDAQIKVEEVPGKPGYYKAVAYLRPHIQLERLDVSLRLVAEMPKSIRKG